MKSLIFKTLIVGLALASQAAFAGDGAGNGDGDLAVRKIFSEDDGLTPVEKIYKMWQESEGSLPTFADEITTWRGTRFFSDSPKHFTIKLMVKKSKPIVAGNMVLEPEHAMAAFDFDFIRSTLSPTMYVFDLNRDNRLLMKSDGKSLLVNVAYFSDDDVTPAYRFNPTDIYKIRKYSEDVLVAVAGDCKKQCEVIVLNEKSVERR